MVTPYVGVWIETMLPVKQPPLSVVTPYVGVWIETRVGTCQSGYGRSHPTWVCGLKHSPLTNP